MRAEESEQITSAVTEALAGDGLTLSEVPTNPDEQAAEFDTVA